MYSAEKARHDKEKLTNKRAFKREIKKVLKDIKYYAKKGYDNHCFHVYPYLVNEIIEGLEKLGYKVEKYSTNGIEISWQYKNEGEE